MKKIIVLGSGETTRANVEALIDDYVYVNKELSLCVIINDKPSDGQVWAAQYAVDKERTVHVYRSPQDSMGPFVSFESEVTVTDNPLDEILPGSDVEALFLWNDEDTNCLNYLAQLSSKGIVCKDLTNGLVDITASSDIKETVSPEIPKQEQMPQIQVSDPDVEDPEYPEEGYEDPLYEGIRIMAEIFAEAIAKELKKVLKK